MKNRISVIIPCYNEQDTLRDVTASVLAIASEGLDVEAVIVDDCSKDGSL